MLKPCPFCGSSSHATFVSIAEYRRMNADDEDYDGFYPASGSGFIFCAASEGGCGAHSGYHAEDPSITWNQRAPIQLHNTRRHT